MNSYIVITKVKCFVVKNNEALCWLLENASDIVDIIQWIHILLS